MRRGPPTTARTRPEADGKSYDNAEMIPPGAFRDAVNLRQGAGHVGQQHFGPMAGDQATVGAGEQFLAAQGLELGQKPADRGLRYAKVPRRADCGAVLHDGADRAEVPKFDDAIHSANTRIGGCHKIVRKPAGCKASDRRAGPIRAPVSLSEA